MSYKKMKPIKGGYGGCLHCGYQHEILPLDSYICVGFGMAYLEKDGVIVYDGEKENDFRNVWTVEKAEELARKEPDCDWRIHFIAPLSERHYQRQGESMWVLYEKGNGFA